MSDKIIHHVIAQTAKEIATAAYEEMAQVNEFYAQNKSVDRYVRRNWRHYIPFARKALVDVLTKDFTFEIRCGQYTEQAVDTMKNEIAEALIIDGSHKAPAKPASSGLLVH